MDMKKVMKLLLVLCLLLLPTQCLAQSVRAVGNGTTAAAAENDALRNAVEKGVGLLVNSSTVVANYAVLEDRIYTNSRGYIKNYQVESRRPTGDGWQVVVVADVDTSPNSALMTALTREGLIDTVLRNPRIAVYIPEEHLAYHVPDPAGETAVIKSLLEAGFTNVIAASPKLSGNRFSWQNGELSAVNAEDMRALARFLTADIVIMGESFSAGVGDPARLLPGVQSSGLQSCRARVEARMYIAKTGQILAADGTYGSGIDTSEAVAAKKALAAAGAAMGSYLSKQILSPNQSRMGFELVAEASGFEPVNRLQTVLASLPGVKNVQLASYENGRGTFSLYYSGAPATLYQELAQTSGLDLEMVSTAYNVLTVRIR